MYDSEEKSKDGKNPIEENLPRHQDPEIRTGDESTDINDEIQHLEKMIKVKKPVQAASVRLIPNQFMGTQEPSQSSLNGINIVESMLRFKWTIIVLTILIAVPSIFAIWTQIVPKYRARAEISVSPKTPILVYKTEDNGMNPLYTSFVNSQVSIIRNPYIVLNRALEQKKVQDTDWYKNPSKSLMQKLLGTPIDPIEWQKERLRKELSVQPRRNTEYIDVSFTAEKGNDAKTIVDTVLDEYIKYIGIQSDETGIFLDNGLTEKIGQLKYEISTKEGEIARIQTELGTVSPEELITAKSVNLEEKQEQLSELQQKIKVLEDANSGGSYLSDEQLRYSQDSDWRQLDMNVRTIQQQIKNSNYTDKHPNMIILKNNLEFAKGLLQRRQEQLEMQWSNKSDSLPILADDVNDTRQAEMPKSLKQQLAQAQQEEKLLLENINNQEKKIATLFDGAKSLKDKYNELAHLRELYNDVQQRLDQKETERKIQDSIASIRVSMPAFVSSEPYNDRRMVFTAMSFFLALGIGGGAAFLRASRNKTVYTPKDVVVQQEAPLLGYIPIVNLKKPIGKSLCKEISQNQFLLNESFRVIRTVLLSRLNGKSCTTLLISSAAAGTGKSTFAMLLGRSLAKTGKKVLFIDADFKKMTLSRLYEHLPQEQGFVQALREPLKFELNLFHEYNLDFMPAGMAKNEDIVPEEIANGAFKTLMQKLSEHYNIILLDGSPILPVADSIIISSQVDGTIFVEREYISNRTDIVDAVERINSSRGHLVGSVFVGSKNHNKYGYDYSYSKSAK